MPNSKHSQLIISLLWAPPQIRISIKYILGYTICSTSSISGLDLIMCQNWSEISKKRKSIFSHRGRFDIEFDLSFNISFQRFVIKFDITLLHLSSLFNTLTRGRLLGQSLFPARIEIRTSKRGMLK